MNTWIVDWRVAFQVWLLSWILKRLMIMWIGVLCFTLWRGWILGKNEGDRWRHVFLQYIFQCLLMQLGFWLVLVVFVRGTPYFHSFSYWWWRCWAMKHGRVSGLRCDAGAGLGNFWKKWVRVRQDSAIKKLIKIFLFIFLIYY